MTRSSRAGAVAGFESDGFETVPEFEITDPSLGAVRYLEHGYPSPRVRWHCHNEYELHLIVASTGKVFVGDYVGDFGPGNLILTGPRLPHNWISDAVGRKRYPLRDMVVHFEHRTIADAAALIPEFRELLPLLDTARRGVEFPDMRETAERLMIAIRESRGPSRFGHFCELMHALARCPGYRTLSTMQFESTIDEAGLEKVDTVVNYVMRHFHEGITLARVARVVGMNASYFSRFFRKSTGNTFSEFLTLIRIGKACELLSTTDRQITDICYEVGYNNVANFNRRFLERKRMTPRVYRTQARQRLVRGGTGVSGVSIPGTAQ